jgi:hypothetical protein
MLLALLRESSLQARPVVAGASAKLQERQQKLLVVKQLNPAIQLKLHQLKSPHSQLHFADRATCHLACVKAAGISPFATRLLHLPTVALPRLVDDMCLHI